MTSYIISESIMPGCSHKYGDLYIVMQESTGSSTKLRRSNKYCGRGGKKETPESQTSWGRHCGGVRFKLGLQKDT